MSERLAAALGKAGKPKGVRRRRKRSDAGKKRGPRKASQEVVQEEDGGVVLVDEVQQEEARKVEFVPCGSVDVASVVSGLGVSEGVFSRWFPSVGEYVDLSDIEWIEGKLGLSKGVLSEAIAMDMPIFWECSVLPIKVPNQRLVYVGDGVRNELVRCKPNHCRAGNRVLVLNGEVRIVL